MSMSTHIIGIKPPDEKWKKMKAVWDACELAGIDKPTEVWEYFDDENPDEAGVIVDIDKHLKEYTADMEEGYELDLTKLSDDIKIIRFTNSY